MKISTLSTNETNFNITKADHSLAQAFVELLSVLRVLTQPGLDREGVDFVFPKWRKPRNLCIIPRQLSEKTTETLGENHGNIWRKPRQPEPTPNSTNMDTWQWQECGSQSSELGSGWIVHRNIIKNRYHVKTEQAGLTFRGNSIHGGAGA